MQKIYILYKDIKIKKINKYVISFLLKNSDENACDF